MKVKRSVMAVKHKAKRKKADPYDKFAKQINEATAPIIAKFFKRKKIVLHHTNVNASYGGGIEIELVFYEPIL